MLTKGIHKRQDLRIEMADLDGNKAYVLYDNFVVDRADRKFQLMSVGNYSGSAGRWLYGKAYKQSISHCILIAFDQCFI